MTPKKRFACNIGWTGRIIRAVTGLVLVADAYLLYRYDMPSGGLGSRVLQGLIALMGAFAIFEGAIGWCAVRALGIRTRF